MFSVDLVRTSVANIDKIGLVCMFFLVQSGEKRKHLDEASYWNSDLHVAKTQLGLDGGASAVMPNRALPRGTRRLCLRRYMHAVWDSVAYDIGSYRNSTS